MMGFGLKGDSLPPTTRFPIVIWFCNISHATVPPAPIVFLSYFFLRSSNTPINGIRVKTCKTWLQGHTLEIYWLPITLAKVTAQQRDPLLGSHFRRFLHRLVTLSPLS